MNSKKGSDILQNTLYLIVPVIGLLIFSGIITTAYRVVFPYLLLTPLVALVNYYFITSQKEKKPLYFTISIYLIVIGFFYFNVTTDQLSFPSPYGLFDYIQVIKK